MSYSCIAHFCVPTKYSIFFAENGDETGGFGGAIYTALGSSTVFERRAIMQYNTGASGGALFNEGTTTLESAGFIRGNKASVREIENRKNRVNAHALTHDPLFRPRVD